MVHLIETQARVQALEKEYQDKKHAWQKQMQEAALENELAI